MKKEKYRIIATYRDKEAAIADWKGIITSEYRLKTFSFAGIYPQELIKDKNHAEIIFITSLSEAANVLKNILTASEVTIQKLQEKIAE